MPPTKSAKERFDDFMLVQDLSYLVDKPQKKTWLKIEIYDLYFFFFFFLMMF